MNNIRKVSPKHLLIMYRILSGQSQKQIAKDMSLSETWVSLVVNDPLFKEEYQKIVDMVRDKVIDTSAEVQETINAATPEAARAKSALGVKFGSSLINPVMFEG